MQQVKDLKDLIRHPYAWPGGYPKFGILADGGAICHKCAKKNFRLIVQETKNTDYRGGWEFSAIDINWEDKDLFCNECSEQIESAYE